MWPSMCVHMHVCLLQQSLAPTEHFFLSLYLKMASNRILQHCPRLAAQIFSVTTTSCFEREIFNSKCDALQKYLYGLVKLYEKTIRV